MLFNERCEMLKRVNVTHEQYYPRTGWVEHDVEEIYRNVLKSIAELIEEEDIIDEALHLLEGYTDPPYPILAAYWGNLSEKHKPKALYLLQGAG